LPLALGTLGPMVFLESSAGAVAVFGLFLLLLAWAGWQRLKRTLHLILGGSALILVLIIGAYFTSLIPPIPLTLRESGIYHDVQHANGQYVLSAETAKPWWEFWQPTVIHHVPGSPLFAFSAVFAPGGFSANVVHEWERYDSTQKKWVPQSTIAFPLSGGRAGGFRGYSEIANVQAGNWRVNIETTSGQVIGRINFQIVDSPAQPELNTETK